MYIQLLLSKMLSFLAVDVKVDEGNYKDSYYYKVIEPVVKVIDSLMIPIIICVGLGGAIFAIVLGVQMARAESTDKRDEVKKKLINAVIGIVVMLIILILMKLLTANADAIARWIVDTGTPEEPTTPSTNGTATP